MSTTPFYHCICYYTHNIYIRNLNKHFTYINKDQFFKDYGEFLCKFRYTSAENEILVEEILVEIERRKQHQENTSTRKKIIQNSYVPLHRSVYKLEEAFLESKFLKLVDAAKRFDYHDVFLIVDKLSDDKKIYSFPIFKPEFCILLLKELLNFEESDFPKDRPNTMNKYGILIDELGFHANFSVTLREQYLDPLARALFPEWRGEGLDSHKVFTVGYKFGQDTDLGYHFDNSEVTINICLGQRFEGGELYFGDMNTTPISESMCILVPHNIGCGILHRGQQYHGALPTTAGVRQNLIMWMRSSSIRNAMCPMCYSEPSLVASEDYGDGFTKQEEVTLCDIM